MDYNVKTCWVGGCLVEPFVESRIGASFVEAAIVEVEVGAAFIDLVYSTLPLKLVHRCLSCLACPQTL